jgi:PBSX family phage terminase large subunit
MTAPGVLEIRKAIAQTHTAPKGLEAYFPPCTLKDCPRAGKRHADVLPHQLEFIMAPEKYLAVVGGVGSAKTLAAAVLGVLMSQQVKGNKGFVGRRTYANLHDSTQRIYLDVLQRVGIEFEVREVRDGLPHRIILPNHSEIVFRETKDIGRWLGSEYGWFNLDEASQEPQSTFTGLQSRLRLPQASLYLKGMLTTNPPHQTDWIPEVFGMQPGTQTRGGSTYRLWRWSSRLNPYLPESYIKDLEANHPPSEVRRIIDGEYGFTFEGKAVYAPPFDHGRHVTELVATRGAAIARSWDFGYRTPAVTWHQFGKVSMDCNTTHWRVLHEYIGKDIEAEDLATIVLDHSATRFPDHPPSMFLDCGDRAGAQVSDKGPGPVIRLQRRGFNFRTRLLPNIDPGLALVRQALRDSCTCGLPAFQISRTCRDTAHAFAGGYHYPEARHGHVTTATDKPKKDGFYDNLADTVRYAGENFYRSAIRDPGLIERLMADQIASFAPEPERHAWMVRS